MICAFCKTYSPAHIVDAIDEGWIPSYWEDEEEKPGPVCAECCGRELVWCQETGDFERRPLAAMSINDYGS